MTREQQITLLSNLFAERKNIMLKKSKDYASQDVLDNFKKAGAITGIKPEVQCLSLISTKVARLGNLLNSDSQPNNESISDSVIDLINYSELFYCLLNENIQIESTSNSVLQKSKRELDEY